VGDLGVYKTETGVIFRVVDDQGHLSVETLQGSVWESAPIGMIGLRVAPTTLQLTARQILRLPA
jgi:hypothetical protein